VSFALFISVMQIPTEIVGSLPRPIKLQEAIAKYDKKEITEAEFRKIQDEAAKESVEQLVKTGETYVTDGEQRISSFATYPLAEYTFTLKKGYYKIDY
jgi:methionine synthase II (cobalamin-independent)